MDGALIIGGVLVSGLVQLLKQYFPSSRTVTLTIVLGLAVLGGVVSWYLQRAGLWESFLQIVLSIGATYAFIIKNMEDVTAEKRGEI